MNQGVEMLLERMRLHPEEFTMHNHKWTWVRALVGAPSSWALPNENGPYITKEECEALRNAYIELDGAEFTRRVAAGIMEEPHEKLMTGLAQVKTEGQPFNVDPHFSKPKLKFIP